MRRTIARVAVTLAAGAAALTMLGTSAQAAPAGGHPESGLVFYRVWFADPVAHFATVDGTCQRFPANAVGRHDAPIDV
jgi:hypothetical protein